MKIWRETLVIFISFYILHMRIVKLKGCIIVLKLTKYIIYIKCSIGALKEDG